LKRQSNCLEGLILKPLPCGGMSIPMEIEKGLVDS